MNLKLSDFLYELPSDRIAKHPPKRRGESKLLFYNKGVISHHSFAQIDELVPQDSLLVFNDTKVIPARIIMEKDTGARIEIFLLEPLGPSAVHEEVMNAKHKCIWKCMIGNAKKWKINTSLFLSKPSLEAKRIDEDSVEFHWNENVTFSDLLADIGKIPLPPYIDREVEEEDQERYQTVYSKMKGAVAAPTAGLHFTNEVIESLKSNSAEIEYLTLHVSAGTFQPIKSDRIEEHPMHNEHVWIKKTTIEKLISANKTLAIGTTSMRTLESLYWYGVKILHGDSTFFVDQKDPYRLKAAPKEEALEAVLSIMKEQGMNSIGGQTEIFLYPGYDYKICDGLVTNYHLPGSTLVLLVASFIGEDWRMVYDEALKNDYRFLSYGDSSLLLT